MFEKQTLSDLVDADRSYHHKTHLWFHKRALDLSLRPGLYRFLQQVREVFLELRQFWCNHYRAVPRIRIVVEIVLMVIFCYTVIAERCNFRHNRIIPKI